MYSNNIITRQISISPNEINGSIDDIILKKIKDNYGDKCIKYGYVDKSSIQIIKRTLGQILTNYLNGDINYIVKFSASICNPQKNLLVHATVKNVNKMGLLLKKGPLNIVVARQVHKDKTVFTQSNLNKELPIVIKGAKFDLNSDKIICLGILYDESLKDTIITETNTNEVNEIDDDGSDIDETDIQLDSGIIDDDDEDIISDEEEVSDVSDDEDEDENEESDDEESDEESDDNI